jgi:cob(I)alamin adenosyltransferase
MGLSMVAQIQAVQDIKPDIKLVSPIPPSQGVMQIFTAPDRTFYVDVIAQAVRLGGQGTSVLIAQFFKGGIRQGVEAPRKLGQNLEWVRCDLSRNIEPSTELTEDEGKAILDLWGYVKNLITKGKHQLIILDDLNLAIERSLISESEVIDTLKSRPQKVDITLTGANIPHSLINIADQVTQRRR